MMKRKTGGYTFIEILVVVTIIALIASITSVSFFALGKSSRDARRAADIETVRSAIEMYRSELGYYPNISVDSNNCITDTSLIDDSGAEPVTYLRSMPVDPKKESYCYRYDRTSNTTYELSYFSEVDGDFRSVVNP